MASRSVRVEAHTRERIVQAIGGQAGSQRNGDRGNQPRHPLEPVPLRLQVRDLGSIALAVEQGDQIASRLVHV